MSTQVGTTAPAGVSGAEPAMGLTARLRTAAPWWLLPATVVAVLTGFGVYAFFTAAQGFGAHPGFTGDATSAPYLSPFYSPKVLAGRTPISPAFWVLGSPLLFRATCYYYRKAYYRSFFWDPPACGIGELRHREYRGESRFPLILNNLHRFFLYLAIGVLAWLWVDAAEAFRYQGHWYIGVGGLLMVLNCVLLSGYTFGCHSLRHLVGGRVDCFSAVRAGATRHRLYRWVTVINHRHPTWAWVSLFSVLSVDVYIRLLNAGLTDLHVSF